MKNNFKLTPQQVNRLLERFTQKELADIFQVSTRTIRRQTKPSKPLQKQGRKSKISRLDSAFLRFHIATNKTTTQKSLAEYFSHLSNQSISQSTICRALKKLKLTYKKIIYQSSEQTRQKNEQQIKEFINETLPTLPQSQILFLDECSFRLNSAPRRGYSLRGTRAISQRPGNKGKNYTFIFLTQIAEGKKVIHSRLIEGGMKSKEFHEFLSELELPNNEKYYLIMDNLSVHKATKSCLKLGLTTIKELLASKNIEPIYLPSYTPELNPVEKCFNITRQYIEQCRPRIKDKLETFLKEKLEFFQEEDLTKYLENSIQECLAKLAENRPEVSLVQKTTVFFLEGLKWVKEVSPGIDINLAWGFVRRRLEDISQAKDFYNLL